MQTLAQLFKPALLASIALCMATPALAAPITYDILFGKQDGFAFSQVHDSEGTKHSEGILLGGLSGTLTFDYDDESDIYTLVSSTAMLGSSDYKFVFTGGQIAGDGGGELDFALTGAGPYAQTSSFFFLGGKPICCSVTNGPNFIHPTDLRLRGETPAGDGLPLRLGIDLAGKASGILVPTKPPSPTSAVPEPSAALVFALGCLLFGQAIRVR